MKFSPTYIKEIAETTGFDPANLEKALRLKEILREIQRQPLLGKALVLKGGTGINGFLLKFPRLSVDIDLNYVGQIDREAMLAERPQIERAVEQVCRGLGYRIQQGTNEHALFQVYLGFGNHAGNLENLEVEVNFLMRVCALPVVQLQAARLADEEPCQFPVLAVEELFAGKLKAMIERSHPRDLYDVSRLAGSGLSYDVVLLRKLAVLFGSTLDHDLRGYTLDRFDMIDQREVERLLYPLLRSDDRPTVDEMMAKATRPLGLVLDHEREEAYLKAMAGGSYRPDLLFPDHPEIAARLARHPALLWKAANVSEFRPKKNAKDREQ